MHKMIMGIPVMFALNISPATALTYYWPVPTGLTVEEVTYDIVNYNIHMTPVRVDDPSISDTDTVETVLNKIFPGESHRSIRWGSFHKHNSPTPGGIAWPSKNIKESFMNGGTGVLWSDFAARVVASAGSVVKDDHAGSSRAGECVGTGMWSDSWPESWDGWIPKVWNAGLGGSSCIGVPPPNEWCALTTPSVTLSYGSIVVGNAQGATARESVGVECTSGVKYSLRLRGLDTIALDNGMSASLTANGKGLNSPLDGKTGPQVVELESTLTGSPATAGPFQGSGILFVSYP